MKRKALTKIMSIFAVLMSLVFPIGLVGCSDDVEPTTPYPIKNFVNFVARIETPITIDSQGDIEAGYIIYEHLKDSYKNNKDVKASKQILDEYKSRFDVKKEEQDILDAAAAQATYRSRFERAVSRLPDEDSLTLKDRADIDAAFELYDYLDETSRAMSSVAVAYAALQLADQIVFELEFNDWLDRLHAQADSFVEEVESLLEEDITLDSANDIEDVLDAYKRLPDEAKEYTNVKEAKKRLDNAVAEYQELKDEADIKDFLAKVKELPNADSVTLDNERDITRAEGVYEKMSEKAQSNKDVAAAYEKLKAVRARYDVIFAEAEKIKIQEFIEAASVLPTDISKVDITWYDMLENASNKYWALSYDSQELPEVIEAFNRWDAAQLAFNKKGYKQIPMTNPGNPGVVLSGDNNLVLQLEDQMFNPLREFFGVKSIAELDGKAILELNIYIDDVFVCKADVLFASFTNNGHILPSGVIVNALQELSAKNDKIKSGANYSLSLSIRDKNGEFIPSKESARSGSTRGYVW